MCDRAKRMIPGLLRRIRDLEAEHSSFDQARCFADGQSYNTPCGSCVVDSRGYQSQVVESSMWERWGKFVLLGLVFVISIVL